MKEEIRESLLQRSSGNRRWIFNSFCGGECSVCLSVCLSAFASVCLSLRLFVRRACVQP